MPIPTAFHERTSQHCTSMQWREWAGYFAVTSYDSVYDQEYFAIRHAAGLMDISPLFKYEIKGKNAAVFLARILSRDMTKLPLNKVSYCCWSDDAGKLMDDGTATRVEDNTFRLTAAEPTLHWLLQHARRYEVEIKDITADMGALALQGPLSRAILNACCDQDLNSLKFFQCMKNKINNCEVSISRTGYTGDLGYEVWCTVKDALPVYDALMEAGQPFRIHPSALDALDVCRVEAGFIMNGVDYFSANHCFIESRKSTPYEAGLGWTIDLDREPFIGQAALKKEKQEGSKWAMVGLEFDWVAMEAAYSKYGLAGDTGHGASRHAMPVFADNGVQIGQATSSSWSSQLKKYVALATVEAAYKKVGTELEVEETIEYHRHKVPVKVVKTPFFNPKRKRSMK